ncbi:hypothetical protein IMZ48_22265 [Candidatus Bathyarchaeota archaeon]|nr:hypothetical protein [Candidatus Bathyarchaeota archaeon]
MDIIEELYPVFEILDLGGIENLRTTSGTYTGFGHPRLEHELLVPGGYGLGLQGMFIYCQFPVFVE